MLKEDTTSARKLVERFTAIDPNYDRIVVGDSGSSGVDRSTGGNEPEIDRLRRHNRALDCRNREMEQELKRKDAEYTAVVSEYNDLAEENRRLALELDVKCIAASHRDATIEKLRAELKAVSVTSQL